MKFRELVPTTLAAILFSLGIYALVDSLMCLAFRPTISWTSIFAFPHFGIRRLFSETWPVLALSSVASFAVVLGIHAKGTLKIVAGIGASLTVIATGVLAYITLAEYEPFRGYLPFIGGFVVWTLANLALVGVAIRFERSKILVAFVVVAIIGSVGSIVGNYAAYSGLYPTLHHAAVIVSMFTLTLSFVAAAVVAPLHRWVSIAAVGFVAVLLLGGLLPLKSMNEKHLHFSELGRLVSGDSMSDEKRGFVEPDPDGVANFQKRKSGFTIPENFKIDDYNVLLIGWEATRYDRTSFNPKYTTSPNLQKASKSGAVYHRAYSPSSGTLHSVSSMFTMMLPSSAPLTTWMRPWNGELSDDAQTIAEHFATMDYDTWWIGHNYEEAFTNSILGLNQGFEKFSGVAEYEGTRLSRSDQQIASNALKQLEKHAENPDDRFFGFIFFVAPHGPYSHHKYEGMSRKTHHDRYLLEIKYADEQFGRVWDFLQSSTLKENTVVVFFSDHGEEFKEHGGTRHKSTVYTESIHVPHVVWIPGMEHQNIDAPMSTMWTLPSLLLTTESKDVRGPLEEHVRKYLGPMLRDTNESPIAELVGHDRIKASVITKDHKINYDYKSKLFQLFDLTTDPYEQKDVFEDDAFKTAREELSKLFNGYDNFRSAFYGHKFEPKKKTPLNKRRKKLQKKRKKKKQKAKTQKQKETDTKKKSTPTKSPK